MITIPQAYNVFSYLVLDLGFDPVTLSVGESSCANSLVLQQHHRCRACRAPLQVYLHLFVQFRRLPLHPGNSMKRVAVVVSSVLFFRVRPQTWERYRLRILWTCACA